ncbi:MAG: CHASE3 domain-containing protein [Gammaproteobacteria bacterium]|nr:CHASE3 domain-containing protein [Gammaproteobacteria bacterium]MBU1440482.1 CHASE3 domain-containing protein [Gammaproteobacteria bacterium]
MALGLLLATLAALALVGISEFGYRQSSKAVSEVEWAQKVHETLNMLLQNMVDAETGQRGYLLTGEAKYREPYDSAVKQVSGNMATLRELYAGRPADVQRLDELSGHVARKLAEVDMSVRLRSEGNEDAWKFVVTTDVGRQEMDAIRKQAGELIAISDQAVRVGQEQIASTLRVGRAAICAAALAGLLGFYLYLRQAQALRTIAEHQKDALQQERNALEEIVRERTASLGELATHLQEVRETERGFLARELHDELGSLLTAAKLDVARLKSRLTDAPDASQRLLHLNDLLNSGIALKRRIIEDLRPSSLSNLGLVASLEILGREFGEHSGIEIEMVLEPVMLDEAKQLTVYRMVQESLTNIGKYAEATEATIVMKNQGDLAMIEVVDNGKGFDMTPPTARSSHGLAGMRHRVETAKGSLTVHSTPGQGTRLTVLLPSDPV